MSFTSLYGKKFGFDEGGLLFDGVPLNLASLPRAKGKDFYVSSVVGHAGTSGRSPRDSLSTIDAAINKCTASQGDRIIVMEGHAEAISTATALNLDVAGITIVGLGTGSLRPTITLNTGTDVTIPVTAANITIRNVVFSANFADIVAFFTSVAAKHFFLDACYFKATATNMNALYVLDTGTVSNDMDGLRIENCKWIEPDLATVGWIKMDGTNDDVRFVNNFSDLGVQNNKSLITVANGKLVTNLQMLGNRTIRLNTDSSGGAMLFHTDGSTNSGMVADNYTQHADTAAELIVTASSGLSLFQNYSSGVNGNSGYVIATIDS